MMSKHLHIMDESEHGCINTQGRISCLSKSVTVPIQTNKHQNAKHDPCQEVIRWTCNLYGFYSNKVERVKQSVALCKRCQISRTKEIIHDTDDWSHWATKRAKHQKLWSPTMGTLSRPQEISYINTAAMRKIRLTSELKQLWITSETMTLKQLTFMHSCSESIWP